MAEQNGHKVAAADLPSQMAQVSLSEAGVAALADAQKEPKSPKSKAPKSPELKEKKPKEKTTESKPSSKQSSSSLPLPDFIIERNQLFDELKKQHDEELKNKPRHEIQITIDAGQSEESVVIGKTWETTPGQLLKHVPKETSADVVVAKVDGKLWDLDRVLEKDCKVRYLSSRDSEGRDVFWHSSAHVLGEAAEHEYGCRLSHGPPTAQGFFYDMALEEGRAVKETEWPSLESKAAKYFKDKQPFERLEVSKENLQKMFGYSKYKLHYINGKIEDGETSTVYRNGSLVDLCQGPHIQNTTKIKAFKIMKVSHPDNICNPYIDPYRIHLHISLVTSQMIHYSAFTELLFLRKNKWLSI